LERGQRPTLRRPDNQKGFPAASGKNFPHVLWGYGNATGRGRAAWPHEVEKDGTAEPLDAGSRIVVGGNDDVICAIHPPEGFVAFSGGAADQPIILALSNIFTPGVARFAALRGETRSRARAAICPVKDRSKLPNSNGACPITLALQVFSPGPAQETGKDGLAQNQLPLA
jgi:hypothetical protein